MPIFLEDGPSSASNTIINQGTLSQRQLEAGQAAITRSEHEYGIGESLMTGIPMVGLDVADTVVSSLTHLNPLSAFTGTLEHGRMTQGLLNALGSPYLQQFAIDNKEGIDLGSGLVGIVGSMIGGAGLIRGAEAIGAARNASWFGRALTLDSRYQNALQAVRLAEAESAGLATIGEATFITRAAAAKEVSNLALLRGVRMGLAQEGVLAATMNQNDFLFSDSVGTNIAFGLAGIGIMAGVERVAARSAMRKIASDQVVTRRFIDAFDPAGSEDTRLNFWKQARNEEIPVTSAAAFDDVSVLLMEREALRSGMGAASESQVETLIRNRESFATNLLARAKEKVAVGVGKGLPHDGRTRIQFGAKTTAESDAARHVDLLLNQDPTAFVNMRYMGAIPDGKTLAQVAEEYEARLVSREAELIEASEDAALNKTQRDRIAKQLNELNKSKNSSIVTFVDGERLSLAEGAVRADYLSIEPPVLKMESDNLFTVGTKGRESNLASIDTDLKLHMPGKTNILELDLYDVNRIYELGEFTAQNLVRRNGPVMMHEKPSWFELDLAERIMQLSNDPNKVQFPAGMTRDSARVESFAQKVEAIQQQAAGISKLSDPDLIKIRNRIIFNLPRQTSAQAGLAMNGDSLPEIIAYALKHGDADKIRQMSLAELKETMRGYRQIKGLDPRPIASDDFLTGNSFTLGKDADGNRLAPLIGVMDPIKPHQWTLDHVAYRVGLNRAGVIGALTGETADEFTRALMKPLLESPESETAFAINTLRDTQLTQPGSNIFARAGNKFLTPEFVARDAPPIPAMTKLRDTVTRINNSMTAKLFGDALGDIVSRLGNPRNRESSLLLDSFFSHARGWDLRDPVRGETHWTFGLADTAANREKYLSMTGREMDKGALLVSPNGTTIALDDLSMEALTRFNKLSDARREMANTLLRAKGLPQISEKKFYVPSPRTRDQFVAFTFDPNGNRVVGKTIVASNQADFAKKYAVIESQLEKLGPGYKIRKLDDIQTYGSIWDRAQLEFEDAGHATNMGQSNRGGLIQPEVEIGAFRNALEDLRNRFYRHTDDLIGATFEDAINGVKTRIAAANEVRPAASSQRASTPTGVYQRWLDAATGSLRINSKDSLHAKVSNGAEGAIDAALSGASSGLKAIKSTRVYEALDAWWARANPFSGTEAAARDFKSLSESLGKYMPIADHDEWLRVNGYGQSPWTTRGVVNQLSGFTSAITLRLMDAATSVMTMGSMVANMPVIMRQMDRMAGESLLDWQHRTRNFGTVIHMGNDHGVGLLDMTKIVSNGIRAVFDPEFAPILKDMAARGMTTQEVAELTKHMAILTPRGPVAKTFLGDVSIQNPKTVGERIKQKGLVGSLSILTDSSENYSRMFSSTVGYKLAESIGIQDHAMRMSFAHNFANNVIADYNPLNRPEIFQGPFGSAAGLFKTFIQNYYQRLFGYVETKNWQPLVAQFVAQGGLFGIPSVPGWNVLDAFSHMANGDGTNATDRVANNSGAFHDIVMGGALSNLPKLLGLPATSIYTRGDTNLRLPSPSPTMAEIAPAVSVISRMVTGLVEAVSAVKNAPMTTQRMGEVLSNMVVNRGMAGILEVAMAGGYDTDRYGQTVSVAKTNAEKAYRLLGVKSMAQEESVRAYYRSKPWLEQQEALRADLSRSIRASIRQGNFDDLLPTFQQQYLERGGNPSYFRSFIQRAYDAAKDTVSERDLDRALKKDSRANDVTRYLEAGVEVSDDESEKASTLELLNSLDQVGPVESSSPSELGTPDGINP